MKWIRSDGFPGGSDEDAELICGLCDYKWKDHSFLYGHCPVGKTKFYWAGSVSIGRKAKTLECPCGIARSDCDYHKD